MRLLGSQSRTKNLILFARSLLLVGAISSVLFLFWISTAAVDPSDDIALLSAAAVDPADDIPLLSTAVVSGALPPVSGDILADSGELLVENRSDPRPRRSCATVEEMGEGFAAGSEKESLRVRDLIRRHFDLHGAARVRGLPSHQFCGQGFVIGKASEAGFGNEMYKILTAAALSVMLNRSLIIGQTRGLYPFGDYISYSNISFTLKEVKHLWRKHDCAGKYRRDLVTRIDNFEKPAETNVLCSDWRSWRQPIIWLQGTTDAVAIQFFLKNIHPGMRGAASILFGDPQSLQSRPNVFGELLRIIISPSQAIQEAVSQVLGGVDPDVALHMRMLTNRSVRAVKAAIRCVRKALNVHQRYIGRPRVVVVSDTPSFIKEVTPNLTDFAEVLYFNYKSFEGSFSSGSKSTAHQPLDFRVKDWGPAPRWVAFVDFFLASHASHAVISGAHRRVGTTYAQLVAALAAANRLGNDSPSFSFSFFSSFQSNLLVDGLTRQVGWGHAWNRFAGPMSCHNQDHQCAFTPVLPPAWWDGEWQSPIPRDIRRLQAYGVRLTDDGEVVEGSLESYCAWKKDHVKTLNVFGH